MTPDGLELASGQIGPESIAVDDTFVYWSNYEDDRVMKVEKSGMGTPIEVHRNDRLARKDIAEDEKYLYWGGTLLHERSKSTGEMRTFDLGGDVVNLQAASGRIYWETTKRSPDTAIGQSMRPDGSDKRSVGSLQSQSFTFTVDAGSRPDAHPRDQTIYVTKFVRNADDAGEIDVIPPNGGPATLFAKTRFVWGIAVDDRYVYWMEGRRGGSVKKKAKNASGETGEVVTLTNGFAIIGPQSMVADANALYWTDLGAYSGGGLVGKVSKTGGDAKALARNQVVPQALAVDSQSVYWVNYGPTANGTVRKIAK